MEFQLVSKVWSCVLIIVCTTLFVKLLLLKKRTRAKLDDGVCRDISSIPCPNQSLIPFIGNSLELLPIKSFWGKLYKPLLRVTGLGGDTVFLNSAPYVQTLLKSTNMDHLNKYGKIYNLTKDIFPTDKNTLLAESIHWKPHRKSLNKLMTCQHLLSYMPLLNKAGRRMADATEKQFSNGLHNEMYDTISVALYYAVLELSTGLDLYGTQTGVESHHDFKTYMALFTKRLLRPWLIPDVIWKLHPSFKLQKKAIDRINKHFDSQRNFAMHIKPFVSVLDSLISEGLSEEVIRDEILFMIIAGHDTSSFAVTMTCLLLALNPEHQEKCYQELSAVWNVDDLQLEISFNDLSQLKYLEWCILESMRIFTPVVFFARQLHSPLKLDNELELPAGTNVAVSPFLLHNNEEYFPNPETFDPLRFSPEEAAKRNPCTYAPFSAGPRNCYGYKFAMMEMKISMAYLLRHFVITTKETIDSVGMLPNVVTTPERHHLFRFDKRDFLAV